MLLFAESSTIDILAIDWERLSRETIERDNVKECQLIIHRKSLIIPMLILLRM